MSADKLPAAAKRRVRNLSSSVAALLIFGFGASSAWSAGTPAGTVIDNTASISFTSGATPITQDSNTVSITVLERIDVVVTLQSGQVLVAANDVDQDLLFTVTNTGNGTETFQFAINNTVTGNDFDPIAGTPASIYFDTDGSGDFSAGDVAYQPGVNDQTLAADESVDMLLVNDIPGGVVNGQIGRSELTATSATGTGAPGTNFAGQGDGGIDAIVGASGGDDVQAGEYLVSDVQISMQKSVAITDLFGGNEPTVGSTLTYTITVEVTNAGTATGAVISDPIPANTTYVANSIELNSNPITDVSGDDEGELDTSGAPAVVVRLGDLTQVDGIQTIEFQVTID